jgi:hypothetical protein
MKEGDWYLFAVPWDWTFVGQYIRHVSFQEIEIANAIYFTRTGATFDILCHKGLQEQTKHHGPFRSMLIPAQGPKFPWKAAAPWVKK